VALVPFLIFFAFCNFLSSHPSVATQLSIEKWAQQAYAGRAERFLGECARYDPRLTYLLRPGRCHFANVEFDTELNVNSFGLRDDETSLKEPEVVVLGDSHAMGFGVEDQETFAQVLEQLLGRKVLNAGINSFGTAREMMLLRLLDTRAAQVIVIQYCDNDLEENQELLRRGTLSIRSEGDYSRLVGQASANYVDWLGPGFAVIRSVAAQIWPGRRTPKEATTDEVQAEAFLDVLSRNADLLKDRQVVILELTGPNKMNANFINIARSRSHDLGLDLTFLDASTVVTQQDHFLLDSHLRASGHEKVAKLIAPVIGARTWPPGDAQY
jgi:lysophospholipase L1-like esterase